MAVANAPITKPGRWYAGLTGAHWRVLAAAFLGFLFDGYETYVLFVVMGPALRQLLPASSLGALPRFAGLILSATLLGWAIGGVLGGVLADYWGRKRTMMVTILLYAVFTGLTALVHSWPQMAFCRLLTGLGLGGEWATGATLIAESWPAQARSKGQSFMQSAFGWGALLSAAVWYFVAPIGGPSAWRYLFLIGVIPAVFLFFIRRSIEESATWLEKSAERRELRSRRRSGKSLSREQAIVADFTVAAVFRDPVLRRSALLCMLMSLGTTVGYWAISSWIPSYVEGLARAAHAAAPAQLSAASGMLYTAAGIIGLTGAGFVSDSLGRRAMLGIFFAGSLIATPLVFLWTHGTQAVLIAVAVNGIFTSGQFSWMAIYPPELFPTAVRATAVAFVFNTARFISFLGPLTAGLLIARLGGFSAAAMLLSVTYLLALIAVGFVPETKGKPLPV